MVVIYRASTRLQLNKSSIHAWEHSHRSSHLISSHFIRLAHLQRESLLFRCVCRLSVPCQISKAKRNRREISSHLHEIGVAEQNMTSDSALKVAKYPESSPKFPNSPLSRSVCNAACFILTQCAVKRRSLPWLWPFIQDSRTYFVLENWMLASQHTGCSKKSGPLGYFHDNFGKYGPILIFFHCYNKKFMSHKN